MEENNEAEGEDLDLNSEEETEVVDTEVDTDERIYTKEEVEEIKKKMQSDSEKGVQKLISKQKSYETMIDVIGKVSEDQKYLIEFHDENPEVAQMILDKYYDGKSIEEFKDYIDYNIDYNDPVTRKRQIELEAKKLIDQQTLETSKATFIEKLKMSESEKKAFEIEFEERKQLKSFRIEDLSKHLEKAYREIAEDAPKNLKIQEAIGKSMATGEGKGGNEAPKKSGLQNEISDFLKTHF